MRRHWLGLHRLPIAILGVALLLDAASVAHAVPPPDETARVQVGDLDFSSVRDVKLFRQRVDRAAQRFCARRSQLDFLEMSACRHGVRRQLVKQLGPDQLRELDRTSARLGAW